MDDMWCIFHSYKTQYSWNNRWHKLEIWLEKSEELRRQYNAAMWDNLDDRHMKCFDLTEIITLLFYNNSHHIVLNPDSTTTNVIVVYDAPSAKYNGKSLNYCLFYGPKIQQDLPGILVHILLHSIVSQ